MNKFLLVALCASFLAAGAQVHAESHGMQTQHPENGIGYMNVVHDMRTASTSTDHKEKRDNGEKPEMRKAIAGIVTSVSSTGFTMSGRGQGKNHATSTLTVTVTPTTIFKIRNSVEDRMMSRTMGSTTPTDSTTRPVLATTTGSLADITVGAKVEVFGKVATSTNSITADKVHINRGKSEGRGEVNKMEHGRGDMASGTPEREGKKGFFEKLKGLFGATGSTSSSTAGGPAATGFIDFLSHALFGWFK